jgi:hypothetical protein
MFDKMLEKPVTVGTILGVVGWAVMTLYSYWPEFVISLFVIWFVIILVRGIIKEWQ